VTAERRDGSSKAHQIDSVATVGYAAQLWQMADALRGNNVLPTVE